MSFHFSSSLLNMIVVFRYLTLACIIRLFTCSSPTNIRAYNWTHANHTISKKWTRLASDSTGQYLAVIDHVSDLSHIYVSKDFGSSWAKSGAAQAHFSSLTSTPDGNLLTATISGGGIMFSKDHGTTWEKHAKSPSGYWTAIVADQSGKRQAAVIHKGGIFVSSDNGETWTKSSAPSSEVEWSSISSDSTGRYLVAVANTGEVYHSGDYGQSWNKSQVKKPNLFWTGVTTDVSGKFVAAVSTSRGDSTSVMENGLYFSNDYGKTFTLKYHMARLTGITMDSTGTVMASILTDSCNNMYVAQSFNGGENFETSMAGKGEWTHVVMNAKGDRLIATQTNGIIATGVLLRKQKRERGEKGAN